MSKIVTIAGGLNLNRVYELSSVRGAFPVFYLMFQHRTPDTCHLCKFTSELENQFLEETCCSQATLTKAIRHLRKENFIKAVLKDKMDGTIWYALNPEFIYSKGDKSIEQELYNWWKDADYIENAKIWQEIKNEDSSKAVKTKADKKDKLGNTGGDQSNPDSNKSNQEPDEPKGDSKEIEKENPIQQSTDELLMFVGGVDKTKFGTWCTVKGGLMRYLEEKARLHGKDIPDIYNIYINREHLDEIVDRFKRGL